MVPITHFGQVPSTLMLVCNYLCIKVYDLYKNCDYYIGTIQKDWVFSYRNLTIKDIELYKKFWINNSLVENGVFDNGFN